MSVKEPDDEQRETEDMAAQPESTRAQFDRGTCGVMTKLDFMGLRFEEDVQNISYVVLEVFPGIERLELAMQMHVENTDQEVADIVMANCLRGLVSSELCVEVPHCSVQRRQEVHHCSGQIAPDSRRRRDQ